MTQSSASRFNIAQDGPRPTDEQLRNQAAIRDAIKSAASAVETRTLPSREQSLALTKLEEALLWAGKAVFA